MSDKSLDKESSNKAATPTSDDGETFVDATDEVNGVDEVTAEIENLAVDTSFSLVTLEEGFAKCLEESKLSVDPYLQGYRELYKFLTMLGTVFGWVASDVKAKIDILQKYLEGKNKEKYQNVKEMIVYECDEGLIKTNKKDDPSGSRTLLRLHRALEYIIAFLSAAQKLSDEDKCSVVSRTAYEETLMKYHPWVVQKAAKLAMGLLPTKKGLVEKICPSGDPEEMEKVNALLKKAIDAMQKVYDVCQEFYKEKDLLEIP